MVGVSVQRTLYVCMSIDRDMDSQQGFKEEKESDRDFITWAVCPIEHFGVLFAGVEQLDVGRYQPDVQPAGCLSEYPARPVSSLQ